MMKLAKGPHQEAKSTVIEHVFYGPILLLFSRGSRLLGWTRIFASANCSRQRTWVYNFNLTKKVLLKALLGSCMIFSSETSEIMPRFKPECISK